MGVAVPVAESGPTTVPVALADTVGTAVDVPLALALAPTLALVLVLALALCEAAWWLIDAGEDADSLMALEVGDQLGLSHGERDSEGVVVTAAPLLEAVALASGMAVELRDVDDVNELVGVTVRVRVGEGHLACWFKVSSPMGPSSIEPDDSDTWQQQQTN